MHRLNLVKKYSLAFNLLLCFVLPLTSIILSNCTAKNIKKPKQVLAYSLQEDSTAITRVSVISPANLYVRSEPYLLDSKNVVYTAFQWIDNHPSRTISVWKSSMFGGRGATKLIPAGDNERLTMANTNLKVNRIYFHLDCSIFSVSKSGRGGRMKHNSSGYCDYSPVPFMDGKKLLFSSCVRGKDCYFKDSNYIWVVNIDGTEMLQLRQGSDPTISSDGKIILFSYQGDIWKMTISGNNVTNLTSSQKYWDYGARFSPDNKKIIFARKNREKNKRNADIWVMNADGSQVIQLTTNPSHDWGPVWGNDNFIYFISNRGQLVGNYYPSRVWRMKLVRE